MIVNRPWRGKKGEINADFFILAIGSLWRTKKMFAFLEIKWKRDVVGLILFVATAGLSGSDR